MSVDRSTELQRFILLEEELEKFNSDFQNHNYDLIRHAPGGGTAPGGTIPDMRVQCPIKWQQKSFTGDGATTTYSVSSYYISGFLRVFINGDYQEPSTHFSELDPDFGTFDMAQAPANNDKVNVEWAEYCDDDLEEGLPVTDPADGGTGLPHPGDDLWEPPWPGRIPSGEGKRVYLSGRTVGNVPKIVRTSNVYATSPVYTNISTGLPGTGVADRPVLHYLSAWDTTKGLCIVPRTSGNGSDALYRATGIDGTPTWSAVFELADLNTALSTSEGDMTLVQVAFTAAIPSRVYLLGRGDSVVEVFVAYSSDSGATWSVTDLSGLAEGAPDQQSLLAGQHDGDVVYVLHEDGATDIQTYKSSDGAQSFAQVSDNNGQFTGEHRLFSDYDSNDSNEARIHRLYNGTSDNDSWALSIDGGVSFSDVRRNTANSIWAHVPGVAKKWLMSKPPSGPSQRVSGDDGATETETATSETINTHEQVSLLKEGVYAIIHDDDTPKTSTDWANFTDRSGNIADTMAVLDHITHDWTS